jgi:hypothetical protein
LNAAIPLSQVLLPAAHDLFQPLDDFFWGKVVGQHLDGVGCF